MVRVNKIRTHTRYAMSTWLLIPILMLSSCAMPKLSRYNLTQSQVDALSTGISYDSVIVRFGPPLMTRGSSAIYPNDHYKSGFYYCRDLVLEFDKRGTLISKRFSSDVGNASLRCVMYSSGQDL